MSAFEVVITPNRVKSKRREQTRERTEVIMAPFSPKAIVQFEDVPVTKTAKRILLIVNPCDEDIEVKVTRTIRSDHNITISWMENTVPAQDEIEMEMIWCPQMDVVCKETMQLTDNRNFRKDVMVILKSKPNKPTKSVRKYLSISAGGSHVKTLRLKSPTGGAKAHKMMTQMQQRKRTQMTEKKGTTTTGLRKVAPGSNVKPRGIETVTVNSHTTSPLSERNIYKGGVCFERKSTAVGKLGDDSIKENLSPSTPGNVIDMIDNLMFTPVTITLTKTNERRDNLVDLPTPLNTTDLCHVHELDVDVRDLRPRRLTTAELVAGSEEEGICTRVEVKVGEILSDSLVGSIGTNNKTFEVKRTDSLDTSVDYLDGSVSCTVTLNKTSTICTTPLTRHLEMIKEEDGASMSVANRESAPCSLQKTYVKEENESEENLKRDIKLVGTPLRKYSDSMKDLSLKSPQASKLMSIQGSMPNLNEMENIRSIEQNRYFYQASTSILCTESSTEVVALLKKEISDEKPTESEKKLFDATSGKCNISVDELNSSGRSSVSHVDFLFDQQEILAQSSRFNLNEVGLKSRKSSPVVYKKGNTTKEERSDKIKSAAKKINVSESEGSKTAAGSHKRGIHDLSLSDSPSTESIASNIVRNPTKTKSKSSSMQVSPPKRQRIEADYTFTRPAPATSSGARLRNWSFTQPKKLKLSKTLSLVKKPITPRKVKEEPRIKLYDSELFLQTCINPDPFAATTTCDPFLASSMYLDEEAVDKHQIDFKKWLNALVALPAELDADCDRNIDVGKLFNEVRHKELIVAPTKEEQSMSYWTQYRLESLRRAAVQLFFSEEMRVPCSKVAVYVNKSAIRIRNDRNLHLDVVMQRYILELLLCFNPLWLRLGLEVVYGEKIHLHSNNDIVGLSTFILNRLFRDKFLEQKYSRAYSLSDEYADYIKKFTLQKFLFLLLFLDKAKNNRIIKHNPCLFVKKSPYKETREILLKFSCELLANMGDISRELKRLDYVLTHKQTFLDEFDYAFQNIAVDLRDGVRLTRIMEIILLRDDLTKQLRVPAISRLQRIFNVNLALRALKEANFELKGDIAAAEIVDGHREKTLSLLWQIIYKFRSPKFHAAATVLQQWWRRKWLYVVVQRRIRRREEMRREMAATKIQSAFRGYVARKYAKVYKEERCRAAVVLQKHIRRHLAQGLFSRTMSAITSIQRWYRGQRMMVKCRGEYLRLRMCVVFLQRCYRRRLLSKKLQQLAEEVRRQRELRRIAAAKRIQAHWRGYCKMKVIRSDYLRQRESAIALQRRYRAKKATEVQRLEYLRLVAAAVTAQRRFRANRLMAMQRMQYLRMRTNLVNVQQRWRATLLMRGALQEYTHLREVIVRVQQRFRAKLLMKSQRATYLRMRESACVLQRRFRARLAMQQQRSAYRRVRNGAILIQRKWRATLLAKKTRFNFISLQYHATLLQQKFRARKQMRQDRLHYEQLRVAVILVQRRYRGKLQMREDRERLECKKRALLSIQRRYRAYKLMRFVRAKFQGTRTAVVCLQEHVRAYLLMKKARSWYLQQRRAAIVLQRAFRARLAMKKARARYVELKAAAVTVQRRYRATLEMRKQRAIFVHERQLVIAMQRRVRAKSLGHRTAQMYKEQRAAVVRLQQRFRATLQMHTVRRDYLHTRGQVVKIQLFFRSYLAMKADRAAYQEKQSAIVTIQRRYRSFTLMRCDREKYLLIRSRCIFLQRKWRGTLAARNQRILYLRTVQQIVAIQLKWRATRLMRVDRQAYERQRAAAVVLQRRYRARRLMLQVRSQYLLIRTLIVCIQQKYRAHKLMLVQRRDYLLLKRTTMHLQQKLRGRILMQEERERFLSLRRRVTFFQAMARGYLARQRFEALMTPEMVELLRRKKAARIIQRFWRGYRIRKRFHNVRIVQIRRNIVLLRQTSLAVNSISNKMRNAVSVLRGRSSASEILNVLICLDRVSRTVPHLLMDYCDFIATFCYDIMAQTIRSEVDKQLIRYCSRILLNLARYDSTTANTFQESGLHTIAHILMRWCDKDSEIFNTLCTLIWLFAHCAKKREIIREFMTTPEAIFVVRETKKLVARKEKMKQNVRKTNAYAPQQRHQWQQNFSNHALPSLEPDYGVIYHKPYTFISSVYAFDALLCKLGIDLY